MVGLPAFVPKANDVLLHIRSLAEIAQGALKQKDHGPQGALKANPVSTAISARAHALITMPTHDASC